jgi:molybdenum cofactor cytidylyltransferase
MQINVILLAAGKGERYQACAQTNLGCANIKQLADIAGKPMIVQCISQLKPLLADPLVNHIYTALGANKNAIKSVIPKDIVIIDSLEWTKGMGNTLAESVRSIQAHSSHVLVALADQALLTTDHYQALINASKKQPNKIIATLCGTRLIAPAIFPQRFFPLLTKLSGDKGAAKLLQDHALLKDAITCNKALFDIDTPADAEQIKHHLNRET